MSDAKSDTHNDELKIATINQKYEIKKELESGIVFERN